MNTRTNVTKCHVVTILVAYYYDYYYGVEAANYYPIYAITTLCLYIYIYVRICTYILVNRYYIVESDCRPDIYLSSHTYRYIYIQVYHLNIWEEFKSPCQMIFAPLPFRYRTTSSDSPRHPRIVTLLQQKYRPLMRNYFYYAFR